MDVDIHLIALVGRVGDAALVACELLGQVVFYFQIGYPVSLTLRVGHRLAEVKVAAVVALQYLIEAVVGLGLGAFLCSEIEALPFLDA